MRFPASSSRRIASAAAAKQKRLASRAGRIRDGGAPPSRRCFASSSDAVGHYEAGLIGEDGLTRFNTLHEMQVNSCTVFRDNELFGTYKESDSGGGYEFMTYGDYDQRVSKCREVLVNLGVREHDKVAIISNNRWEWATITAAAYSLSATIVPMYEAQLESDWTYILNDCNASVLVCATQDIFDRVQKNVLQTAPSVQACICLNDSDEVGKDHSFSALMDAASSGGDDRSVKAPNPEDLADLIYTSGTTGKPKGVELTHDNLSSNVKGSRFVVKPTDKTLAFLPWAHSYGQTVELWNSMSVGASMSICRGVPFILDDLQMAKPTILMSVPTLYKKVYDGVHNIMEGANPIRKSLMQTALALGSANADHENGLRGPLGPVDRMKLSVLDKVVLSKIRDRFGGRLRFGCVAGAACAPEVLKFMDALGIPILEGYGLTETSPIITMNDIGKRRVGSVGQPISGVFVYIVDEEGNALPVGEEGEICCVGPNVMKGYHNNAEATDEVISLAPDGVSRMFHTGDMGRMDADGWVSVTGRLKEQYKLENGKYIAPAPVETAIGMSRFIGQVVLYGANQPYNIALVVPEWAAIRTELELGDDVSEEELASDPRVRELMDSEIAESCSAIKKFAVPRKWAFVAPFTAANNMLTPKMSIRRHMVIKAYEDVISDLYGDGEFFSSDRDQQQAA